MTDLEVAKQLLGKEGRPPRPPWIRKYEEWPNCQCTSCLIHRSAKRYIEHMEQASEAALSLLENMEGDLSILSEIRAELDSAMHVIEDRDCVQDAIPKGYSRIKSAFSKVRELDIKFNPNPWDEPPTFKGQPDMTILDIPPAEEPEKQMIVKYYKLTPKGRELYEALEKMVEEPDVGCPLSDAMGGTEEPEGVRREIIELRLQNLAEKKAAEVKPIDGVARPTDGLLEPEKKGEWIYEITAMGKSSYYTCSLCGEELWGTDKSPLPETCPGCGASMEGE